MFSCCAEILNFFPVLVLTLILILTLTLKRELEKDEDRQRDSIRVEKIEPWPTLRTTERAETTRQYQTHLLVAVVVVIIISIEASHCRIILSVLSSDNSVDGAGVDNSHNRPVYVMLNDEVLVYLMNCWHVVAL